MLTDFHTHVFHPAVAAKALARIAAAGCDPVCAGVAQDLVARAAKAGIERVVCLAAALTGEQVRPANNFILSLAGKENPFPAAPQIMPFGAIHPDYERWEDELDRLERAKVKGLKLHPNFQNLPFDDPRLFPVMEAIGERFIVLCHVGCEKPLENNAASPYKLAKLITMFPKVRIVAAHLGGYTDGKAALDALAGKDIWLDTSNTHRMDDYSIRAIIDKHPFERLLFGTDYPLFDPEVEVARQQKRFGFSDARMHDLMRHANDLLGPVHTKALLPCQQPKSFFV